MLALLGFSFLGGIITILSPCILPVLPIVLSASTNSGKKRPLGVIIGFVLGFTVVTLSLAALVRVFNFPPDVLRIVAAILILVMGLTMLVPKLQVVFEQVISRLSSKGELSGNRSGLFGGIITGLSLGFVWAPCVGPIMAAVISLAITESVSFNAVLITLAYSLGTAIPLLAIMLGGRKLLQKIGWLKSRAGRIQQVFAALMLVAGVGIFFNLDRRFQSWVLDVLPGYGSALTGLEENSIIDQNIERLTVD